MGHKVKQSLMSSRVDFFYYAFRNILLVSIPLLVISGIVLSHLSFHSSATGSSSGTDQIQFSLSTSCTMSSVIDEAHTKEINNGTYHSNVGKTTITTLCNDGNGYSVYAVGYSNNEEGNAKLINAEHPEFSIDTGLATSGLISNWAMKLNNIPDDLSPTPAIIEPAYDNTYGLVPQYWTRVASRSSGTTDMDEGSSFTTTYAIYTTSNQHAGTYNGQVKYVLTHPSTQPYVYYMQEVDKWKNTVAMEESVQAIDMRDGKKYWVTKLKDGNIWMTQNLDLDLDPAKPLTSNDTDLTDHSLTGAYADGYSYDPDTGVTTWTPERETIDFQNTTITGWINDNNNPYSASKTDGLETGHTSLGNYYNWTAAIASNNSNSLTAQRTNVPNSICPKGWRLPKNNPSDFSALGTAYNITNNTAANLRNKPLYFVWSGIINDVSLLNLNTNSRYWTGTVNGSTFAYALRTGDNSFDPSGSDLYRYLGFPIRCIAR